MGSLCALCGMAPGPERPQGSAWRQERRGLLMGVGVEGSPAGLGAAKKISYAKSETKVGREQEERENRGGIV